MHPAKQTLKTYLFYNVDFDGYASCFGYVVQELQEIHTAYIHVYMHIHTVYMCTCLYILYMYTGTYACRWYIYTCTCLCTLYMCTCTCTDILYTCIGLRIYSHYNRVI